MRKKLAITLLIATAILALSGCIGTAAIPAAVPTPNSTTTVKENGNGRIDSGESMAIPNTATDLKNVACSIVKSGKLTAVNAQQLNGYGQFMNYLASKPDGTNTTSGATTAAAAAKLASIYIPFSQDIYARTTKANIDLPADVKAKLTAVCAGDLSAGVK